MIFTAIWIVESAYGYLKLTFANAALFKIVTKMLLFGRRGRYGDAQKGRE